MLTLAAALVLALPVAGAAQDADTWVSGWGGVLMDPGTVRDGESGTEWDFGTSFIGGASVQHLFGNTLVAGLELGYSPVRHEVRDADTDELLADGRADLVTAMAVGRLGGGGRGFFTYATAGAGTMIYGIPSLDRWDPDLALRAGGGVQYGATRRVALFVEWNRWWVFHQSEGVEDNTVRHSHLEIGARYGL
ncbi:MAG TPA: outer membrane beta-barrel protein [Longimicrobiales bacterium]|nr:outer membrane beta-barrel protein [Longimicrobiales bacterium]